MVALWVIKSNPSTSIGFPVMLVVICAIRKFMECIFTKRELRLLDDLLPESDENVRKGNLTTYFIFNFCLSFHTSVHAGVQMLHNKGLLYSSWLKPFKCLLGNWIMNYCIWKNFEFPYRNICSVHTIMPDENFTVSLLIKQNGCFQMSITIKEI